MKRKGQCLPVISVRNGVGLDGNKSYQDELRTMYEPT